MVKVLVVVMAVVGCGAKPAEPLENPTPLTPSELPLSRPPHVGPIHSVGTSDAPSTPHVLRPGERVFPRPVIETPLDPPDVSELGRWPLTVAEHPALEPHFDIAAALADAGVTWTDLCARGAQHRHLSANQELVAYLDAWCSVPTGNYSGAVEKLGHVRNASNARLVRALKYDVAALAAAHGFAHDLESFLRDGGFLDVEQVDLIAAAYFEIGKLDDAAEANRLAEGMDRAPSETIDCTRRLRAIADASPGARDEAIEDLRRLANPPQDFVRLPRCRKQYDLVTCWKDRKCKGYWSSLGTGLEGEAIAKLGHVYERWDQNYDGFDWFMAASNVSDALPFRDRYRLLVPAIDLALRTMGCTPDSFSQIESLAKQGIDDLEPPRSLTGMSFPELQRETQRTTQLAKLASAEIKTFRFRLETTLTEAQRLFRLTPTECRQMRATLPTVQP